MPNDLKKTPKDVFRAIPNLPPNVRDAIQRVSLASSRNPQILSYNERELELWKARDPDHRTITKHDIDIYKEHVDTPVQRTQTVFSSPQKKTEIPPLAKIRTPEEFSLWLNHYRQNLPEEFRKRMYISPTDFMQKKVFYPKFWKLISSTLPPEELDRLNTYTQSARQSEIYPRFIYWRNHLPHHFQAMVPDELYQVYAYAKLNEASHPPSRENIEIFEAQKPLVPPHEEVSHAENKKSEEPVTKSTASTTHQVVPETHISDAQENLDQADVREQVIPPTREEAVLNQENQISETLSSPADIQQAEEPIMPPNTPYSPLSYPTSTEERMSAEERSDQPQQSTQSSTHNPNYKQMQERYKDLKNPQRVIDRTKQQIENIKNPKQLFNNKINTYKNRVNQGRKVFKTARNLFKTGGKLGRTGATAAEVGAAGGAGAAGAGGVTVAGAGAVTIGGITIGTIFLIIFCVLMVLFVLILFALLFFAILFGTQETFDRIIVQKTANKTAVPNPADATTPEQTDITFTISATYDKKSSGIAIYDNIPDNAEFVSAEGNYRAYDAQGNIVTDPENNKDTIKQIVWTIGNNTGTPSSTAPGGTTSPSGWPTNGTITQGPRGAYDHETHMFQPYGYEALDIGAYTGTPLYATFDGVVQATHFLTTEPGSSGNGYWGTGNSIELSDDKRTFTILYGHLSQINVQQGASVKRGDVIGLVGNTGVSTGAHLHWEFRGLPLRTPYIPQDVTPSNCDYPSIPCSPSVVNFQ